LPCRSRPRKADRKGDDAGAAEEAPPTPAAADGDDSCGRVACDADGPDGDGAPHADGESEDIAAEERPSTIAVVF